jgi:hypothetical protein
MAQAATQEWTTPDGALGFSANCGDFKADVRVFCTRAPAQYDTVKVALDKTAEFTIRFPGGYYAYGTLVLNRDGAGGAVLVAAVSYGAAGVSPPLHAQGVVACFPDPDVPPCPPLPINPVDPFDPVAPVAPVDPVDPPDPWPQPVNDGDGVLFPYMYIRTWPLASASDVARRFVSYVPLQPAARQDSLFAQLASATSRRAREALALDFIEGSAPFQGQFVSETDVHAGTFALLMRLSDWLRQYDGAPAQAAAALTAQTAPGLVGSDTYAGDLERIWESYVALVIAPWSEPALLPQMSMLLVAAHALRYVLTPPTGAPPLDARGLRELAGASVILPGAVFPLPPAGLPATPTLSSSSSSSSSPALAEQGWIEPYAIGDLQLVRQRLLRHVPGDIAAIDNIARGERREVSRRRSRRQHEMAASATADADDLATRAGATRADLLAETVKTIATKTSTKNYTNLATTYGPPTVATINGGPVTTTVQQGPNADDVTRFARDVLNQTVHRIRRGIDSVRSSSLTQEASETNSSTLDNSQGMADRTIIYRWVNKVYEARVVNYGQRLMLEFVLPAPSSAYRREVALGERAGPCAPPPAAEGMGDFADIATDNYARLAAKYGARDIVPPPVAMRYVSAVLAIGESSLLAVPPGYYAGFAVVNAICGAGTTAPSVLVGTKTFSPPYAALAMASGCGNTVPIAVGADVANASPPDATGQAGQSAMVTITVTCMPTEATMDAWRIQTYNAVMAGYDAQCAARSASGFPEYRGQGGQAHLDAHQVAAHELRRGCLNLIQQYCATLTGDPDPAWQHAGRQRSGSRRLLPLEEMFEWSEMSFRFYRKNGADAQPVAIDDGGKGAMPLAAFLDASLARVLVPARPAYVYGVLYMLSSGMLWEAGQDTTPVASADVAIVNEFKTMACARQPGCHPVGPAWEVVVPTAMQVIDGVALP